MSKLDAGIAVENIALAAQSMGLGSLIIGIIDDAMRGEKKIILQKSCSFRKIMSSQSLWQ